ncbi:TRAP transporter substrate-binding protein DctP [Marinobacterium marinum]|uniref:TRAP transporter substrate-binding protein DctP n=1 Tax=Marinobacterium marinum TaxID=2756129 RepID=A0A7W1WXT9_9GAMM|nr:TRAP transporter substrate-binding protein DctP [Marinobacterium marinum]MBA4502225.1 TRAP transporter substrate-binding protein DctP [Marinobacterium marinum]
MTIKPKLSALLTSCALTAALSLPFAPAAQADDSFILAQAMNTDHIFHAASERFIDELKAQNSSYAVAYHPGGDLGDWTSLFEQTVAGAIPMTITYGHSEFDPRLDLTWLGYVVDSWASAREVYGPGGPMVDVYNRILEDNDLVSLGVIPTGFGSITMRKGTGKVPTNFPEDAKGIKIRVVPTPLAVERFNNLGFSAVPMPLAEVYTSLQLGTVDARAFGAAVEIWQMRDVLESYILTRDYFEHAFWLVNRDWWISLPASERDKIQTAANATLSSVWDTAQSIDEKYLDKVRDHGINVVELTPEQMQQAKNSLYTHEWPYMEEIVGSEIMQMMRKIAAID